MTKYYTTNNTELSCYIMEVDTIKEQYRCYDTINKSWCKWIYILDLVTTVNSLSHYKQITKEEVFLRMLRNIIHQMTIIGLLWLRGIWSVLFTYPHRIHQYDIMNGKTRSGMDTHIYQHYQTINQLQKKTLSCYYCN